MIDFVVPYVDPEDPAWRRVYEGECRKSGRVVQRVSERYRDFGTLEYCLKGVRRFMPWIRKLFLLVERESQVPAYARDYDVEVVFHHDIMPADKLPTYNSTAFEMYVWRIPGLSERFVYGNDDMIPVGALSEEDFFVGNVPRLRCTRTVFNRENVYQNMLKCNEEFVCRLLGREEGDWHSVVRFGHTISPMLKSTWARLWELAGDEIESRVSQWREKWNLNQDVSAVWHLLSGNYAESSRRTAYYDMRGVERLRRDLMEGNLQVVCVNDSHCRNYARSTSAVKSALLYAFG